MKTLKKALLYSLILLVVLVVTGVGSVYVFRDKIIEQFITEANKQLNTPVKIGKVEVVWWTDFPNLALVFHNVYVEDSHPEESPLLEADRISFYIHAWDIWNENFAIKGLQINNSQTQLKIDAKGETNYVILKPRKEQTGEQMISLDLRNVRLMNTVVSYQDESQKQNHFFESDKLITSVAVKGSQYTIEVDGEITTRQIGIQDFVFLQDKTFNTQAHLIYDDDLKKVTIDASTLSLGRSIFDVKGQYIFQDTNEIDLSMEGKETDIQTILSLFPAEKTRSLQKYQSQGDVFFGLRLSGEISKRKDPLLSIRFGCTHATIYHPDYQARLEKLDLEGSFASPSLSSFNESKIFLKGIRGTLNEKPFEADFSLQNFNDPLISVTFKGVMDAAAIHSFYPMKEVANLKGEVTADISFEGELDKLKKKSTAQQVKAEGSIDLSGISFDYENNIPFRQVNGTLQFNNNDLAMSDLSGKIGRSDFLMNGYFKNIITFFLFENQPLGIETDLLADQIDLDELLTFGYTDSENEKFAFSISPLVYLHFNCDVKALHYKKFNATRLKGDLLVKNQVASSKNIDFQSMGGELSLSGIVNAQSSNDIEISSSWKVKDVHVDSVFYVFENFYQGFIQDKHLRGQASAEVVMEMRLASDLKLKSESLIADINATIKNGQLNNFEPLQALNRYLDDEGLAALRFADLKNEIHIENQTIYIPQMDIRSNVTTIQISGTHALDQKIDYRIIAPLRSKRKIDPDEAFGAIEEDKTGQPKLFLKITGTTDHYEVSYDKQAVKKKINADLKKEVQELKDAFKLKGQKKKKELELTTEEFDWDHL